MFFRYFNASLFFFGVMVSGHSLSNTLDERCVVNILNRTVQVSEQGTWAMPNVPSFMGQVRARATCITDDGVRSGVSPYFNVMQNATVKAPVIFFDEIVPSAKDIRFSSSQTLTLETIGEEYDLDVLATYSNGEITLFNKNDVGLNFSSSNQNIVSVNSSGIVTAINPGRVLISARLDGALAIKNVIVVAGEDKDQDGIPDDYEIINNLNPNDPFDAQEDQDRDGLSALDEFNAGTDPNLADSDQDGLNDYEELNEGEDGFITDPLQFDSDGDGLNDGLEFLIGSNPTDVNSGDLAEAINYIQTIPDSLNLTFNLVDTEVSEQIQVVAHMVDDSEIDITDFSMGSSYDSNNLSIASFGLEAGRIFGGQSGNATVTVSNSGFMSTVEVVVDIFEAAALSVLNIPGYANNIDVSGNYAYIASGANGLTIVDISDKLSPQIVSVLDTPGTTIDVKVVADTVFLADGESGLQIVDVSDRSSPALVATFDTLGVAQDIQVESGFAFIACGEYGLSIVNISDINAPIETAILSGLGVTKGVDVREGVVVIGGSHGLHFVDITDKYSPNLLSSINAGLVKDLSIKDDFVYVASYTSGYRVVNFSDPKNPQVVTFGDDFFPRDVAVTDGLALFAEQLFPNAITYLNIRNPNDAFFQGTIDLSSMGDYAGTGISLDSRYAFVTGENFIVEDDYKADGVSSLMVAQYRELGDSKRKAPVVEVVNPSEGEELVEATKAYVEVDAIDDVAVDYVRFIVDGVEVGRDSSAPYRFPLEVPEGKPVISIYATATDLAGNMGISTYNTFVILQDTDGDGLGDSQEVNIYFTDSENPDTDEDGLSDSKELVMRTDPLAPDSDGDGIWDGDEVAAGTDPLNDDVIPPYFISTVPLNGDIEVIESSSVEIIFNEQLSPKYISRNNVQIVNQSTGELFDDVIVTLTPDGTGLRVRPRTVFQPLVNYSVSISGVRDLAGNVFQGSIDLVFTTANVVDLDRPIVVGFSPGELGDVPVNTQIRLEFNEPIDNDSVLAQNIFLTYSPNERLYCRLELSDDRRTISILPDRALSVGTSYQVVLSDVKDLKGNILTNYFSPVFTTSFESDFVGPKVLDFSIAHDSIDIPTNVNLQVAFDEQVSFFSLHNVRLFSDGQEVSIQARDLDDNHKVLTIILADSLEANSNHTLDLSGVTDLSNNLLQGKIELSFITGESDDNVRPETVGFNPKYVDGSLSLSENRSGLIPLDTVFKIKFNERLSKLFFNNSYYGLRQYDTNELVISDVTLSDDLKTIILTPRELLKPDVAYRLNANNILDISGNGASYPLGGYGFSFKTVPEDFPYQFEVVGQSVVDGMVGVSPNSTINLRFSMQVDDECLSETSFQVIDVDGVSLNAAYSLDIEEVGSEVYYVLSQNIISVTLPNLLEYAEYQLKVSGLCDVGGNYLDDYYVKFTTTSDDGLADTYAPEVVSIFPSSSSTDVALNSTVSITFSESISGIGLSGLSVSVNSNELSGERILSADQKTITFLPESLLPSNSEIKVSVLRDKFEDLTGNILRKTVSSYFTTQDLGGDEIAPYILSITPSDNSVDIDPASNIVVTFSETMDKSTIYNSYGLIKQNIALFANGERLDFNMKYSENSRTLHIDPGPLPENSIISIALTDGISDLFGNTLDDVVSIFSTSSVSSLDRPSIVNVRPNNGGVDLDVNQVITLYSDAQLDEYSVLQDGGIYVSENGSLISGNVSIHAEGRAITFTPDRPFVNGSLIQIFVTDEVEDLVGNKIVNFQSSFRVSSETNPEVMEIIAASSLVDLSLNPVINFRFNQDIGDISEVILSRYGSDTELAVTVASDFILDEGDRSVLQVIPTESIPSTSEGMILQIEVESIDGDKFSATLYFLFSDDAQVDSLSPKILNISPYSSAKGVPINSQIAMTLSEPIDSVYLSGKTPINGVTGSWLIEDDGHLLLFIPHTELPVNSEIQLNLSFIKDGSGNPIDEEPVIFETGSHIDVEPPTAEWANLGRDEFSLPTNSSMITFSFSEPIQKNLWDLSGSHSDNDIIWSIDGSKVDFLLDQELYAAANSYIKMNIRDFAGNESYIYRGYEVGFGPDDIPPSVIASSIIDDWDQVPRNAVIQILFSEPVVNISDNNVALSFDGKSVIIDKYILNEDRTLLTLEMPYLLESKSSYYLTISGVSDFSRNVQVLQKNISFTTGSQVDLIGPRIKWIVPYFEGYMDQVPINTEIKTKYNERINPILEYLYKENITLTDEDHRDNLPITVELFDDYSGVSLNISSNLSSYIYYKYKSEGISDIAGNTIKNSVTFETGSNVDTTPVEVISQSIGNDYVGAPLDSNFTFKLDSPISNGCLVQSNLRFVDVNGVESILDNLYFSDRYDNNTIVFTQADLLPNSSYTAVLSGLCDLAGNLMQDYTFSFTTGLQQSDMIKPSVVSVESSDNSSKLMLDSNFLITFNEAVSPASFDELFVYVDNSPNKYSFIFTDDFMIPGSLTFNQDQTQVLFSPEVPLPPSSNIVLSVGSYRDLSGNIGNQYSKSYVTEADKLDTTPPELITMTPNDNSVDLSLATHIVLTFSEPLQYNDSNGFGVFANSTELGLRVFYSQDGKAVTLKLSDPLPSNSIISVVTTDALKDLSGNSIEPSVSLFTTGSDFSFLGRPSIVNTLPFNNAANVPLDKEITVYFNKPLNEASVTDGGIYVISDGSPVEGSLKLVSDNRALIFTPTNQFDQGSTVQVYVTDELESRQGDKVFHEEFTFRVEAVSTDGVPYLVTTSTPDNVPYNAVFELLFNESISQDATAMVYRNGSVVNGSFYIPASVEVTGPENNVLRITPVETAVGTTRAINIEYTVTDMDGNVISGSAGFEYASPLLPDEDAPFIKYMTPKNNGFNYPINSSLLIEFNEAINPVSLDSSQVLAGYSGSFLFSDGNKLVQLLPNTLFEPNSSVNIDLSGVKDSAANQILDVSDGFDTNNKIDFEVPIVVSSTPEPDGILSNNGLISLKFNEPVSLRMESSFILYNIDDPAYIDVDVRLSDDGTVFSAAPQTPLGLTTNYLYQFYVEDLAGNQRFIRRYFTTSAEPDTLSPEVITFSINNNLNAVPINAELQVAFSEAVTIGSAIEYVRLFKNGSEVEIIDYKLDATHTVLTLVNSQLLDFNSEYKIEVSGVKDLSGNAVVGNTTTRFYTSNQTDLTRPKIKYKIPINDTTAPVNTVIATYYSEKLNPVSIHTNKYQVSLKVGSDSVPFSLSLSDDGTGLIMTPAESLIANSIYTLRMPSISDLAGHKISDNYLYSRSFTTTSGVDDIPLQITGQRMEDDFTDAPLDAKVFIQFDSQLNPECYNQSNLINMSTKQGEVVPGQLSIFNYNREALEFTPNKLKENTQYQVSLSGLCDLAGNNMEEYSHSFSTAVEAYTVSSTSVRLVSSYPATNEVGVTLDSQVVLNFDQPIGSLSKGNLLVTIDGLEVKGEVLLSQDQTTLKFIPSFSWPQGAVVNVYLPFDGYWGMTGRKGNSTININFTTVIQ